MDEGTAKTAPLINTTTSLGKAKQRKNTSIRTKIILQVFQRREYLSRSSNMWNMLGSRTIVLTDRALIAQQDLMRTEENITNGCDS